MFSNMAVAASLSSEAFNLHQMDLHYRFVRISQSDRALVKEGPFITYQWAVDTGETTVSGSFILCGFPATAHSSVSGRELDTCQTNYEAQAWTSYTIQTNTFQRQR